MNVTKVIEVEKGFFFSKSFDFAEKTKYTIETTMVKELGCTNYHMIFVTNGRVKQYTRTIINKGGIKVDNERGEKHLLEKYEDAYSNNELYIEETYKRVEGLYK